MKKFGHSDAYVLYPQMSEDSGVKNGEGFTSAGGCTTTFVESTDTKTDQ